MVKQVGGDTVSVITLADADTDAHAYQPKPADSKALANAKMVFINGLGFEGWIDRMIKSSGFRGDKVVLSTGAKTSNDDPHAWQDLANGRVYVRNIADALTKAMPEKADYIKSRAQKYDAELAALDERIHKELSAIPENNRKIITSHDAFGYFGRAYGVKFLSPVGVSTEAEPSAASVAKLIEQIKTEKVGIVFVENMSSPKLITRISKESGAQMGGELYSDALSSSNGPAPTYIAIFDHNLRLMLDAMKAIK